MTAFERDASEVEALLTDRYLESVLARAGTDLGPADSDLDPALRLVSDRLRRDLIRVHPSFRFEERLAIRLAEAAAALRMGAAVGAEGDPIPFVGRASTDDFDPLAFDDPSDERRELPRPLLIGGALTSAAISLAGAAIVAWRLAHPGRAGEPDGPGRQGRPRRSGLTLSVDWTPRLMPIKLPSFRPRRDAYPPDLWTKCPSCEEMLFNKQLDKVQRVCPNCGHHFRLSADARLALLLDHGSFVERDGGLQSVDPLGFVDQKAYPDRVAAAQLATGMRDAAIWGTGTIDGRPVAICVMDFGFMGGSMGAVVGEKVTRASEHALAQRLPLIIVSASGGARMQEGTLALMQLAKSVAALERLREAGVPFISVLSDPTTGGVFASFAVLGDINLAEPNALIGFAGARVSAGTISQELPVGFQRSEFLFQHGFLDRIVHRSELRPEISLLLSYLQPAEREGVYEEPEQLSLPAFRPLSFLSNLAERVMPSDPEPTNGVAHLNVASGSARVPIQAAPAVPPRAPAAPPPTDPIELEPVPVMQPPAEPIATSSDGRDEERRDG